MSRILIALVGLVIVVGGAALAYVPGYIESITNRVVPHEPYTLSDEARDLHATLKIADLHSDTLLWARDPLAHAGRGHVDVPRLQLGNVALQVFSVVTKTPEGQNYDTNTGDTDQITSLVMVQRWPIRTWDSLLERALYQAERLHEAAAEAPDGLRVVTTAGELEALLTARAAGSRIVGGLLATEGGHPLEGDIANLQKLFDAGYRMIGLHHFFDNGLGGSLHGVSGAGLSRFGKEVVREAERLGLIIDVAHSSAASVEDVLALTERPIVVSHTGVRGACDSARNLPDALMKRIAGAGGLIGIGYWEGAVCDPSPAGIVRSIRYAIDLVGADHVALGSDYDGATEVMFDTSELAVLTDEMLKAGFSETEIAKVMGGNTLRFLAENLPR